MATVGRDMGIARIGDLKLAGRLPAVLKDVNSWRYVYSLGGMRLFMKLLLRLAPGSLARA
ncbi:MAG: hypothetical protein H0Z37_07270 [Firmicutes bacterium]|nr:hypothetical protein [Bacillota bacterium]